MSVPVLWLCCIFCRQLAEHEAAAIFCCQQDHSERAGALSPFELQGVQSVHVYLSAMLLQAQICRCPEVIMI